MTQGHRSNGTGGTGTGLAASLIAAVLGLLVSACQGPPVKHPEDVRSLVAQSIEPEEVEFTPLPPEQRTEVLLESESAYRIGPADVLQIVGDTDTVAELENAPRIVKATVKPDGKVYLPVIGAVQAEGKTVVQFQSEVQQLVAKYKENAFVSVDVEQYRSQKFYVLGQVVAPGVYTVDGRMTLLEAMTQAGGVNELGDLDEAYVLRKGEILPISFRDLMRRGDLSRNITMQRDDVVFVPKQASKKVYVLGEVLEPGVVPFDANDSLTLAGAIAGAQGLDPTNADQNVIRIFRGSWHNPTCYTISACEAYTLGEGIKMQTGDRILVAPLSIATVGRAINLITPIIVEPARAILVPLLTVEAVKNIGD